MVNEVEYELRGFIQLVSLEEHRKLPSCKRFLDNFRTVLCDFMPIALWKLTP